MLFDLEKLNMKSSIILIFVITLLSSCKNADEQCGMQQVCTEEFRSIVLSISDKNGNPIILDSYSVTNQATEKVYNYTSDTLIQEGQYILADDRLMDDVVRNGNSFLFVGMLSNQEVVRETYVIGHDCCHIQLLSGNTDIIIE